VMSQIQSSSNSSENERIPTLLAVSEKVSKNNAKKEKPHSSPQLQSIEQPARKRKFEKMIEVTNGKQKEVEVSV
jgi:hypothetical protein